MLCQLTILRVLSSKNIKTCNCCFVAARCWNPGSQGWSFGAPCLDSDPRAGVHKPELPGFAFLLSLLSSQCHLRGHHPLPLRYQRALCAHAVPPATETLVAFQRRDHAMVPAPGTLRGPGVSPLQSGVTSPEEEWRRVQQGRGHLQTTERGGGMPGEAQGSDPALHQLRGRKNNVFSRSKAANRVLFLSFFVGNLAFSEWLTSL